MLQPLLLIIGLIPLIFRLGPLVLPTTWTEPYAYWSSDSLNRVEGREGPTTQWRNQGYWRDTDVYPDAAEALGRRLLDFADAKPGGSVLDMAHGAGESLALHLSQDPPPSSLIALTSLKSETLQAQKLVSDRYPDMYDRVIWQTNSASFHPSSTSPKNLAHPLNPMKGYMGSPDAEDADEASDLEDEDDFSMGSAGQSGQLAQSGGYDLIYILDSIYHFPPSVPHFLTTALGSLAPGGVIAYTDILPPANLPPWLSYWVLPTLVGVPTRNLASRPNGTDEYKAQLSRIGYVNVEIEDWTKEVFPGFARFLRGKGGAWTVVARGAEWAYGGGWKFVAVRAERPKQVQTMGTVDDDVT